jgi:hypothetical protein
MKISQLILLMMSLMASPAWALSQLHCTSNQGISYQNINRVGGAHPFPGMVTNVEEVIMGNVTSYRLVTRESCAGWPDCEIQSPELTDILPEGFDFGFYPDTKVVLSRYGIPGGRVGEVYAIQFRVGHLPNVWMLCDFWKVFAP